MRHQPTSFAVNRAETSPSPASPAAAQPKSHGQAWLFSARVDLWMFAGSATLVLAFLALGNALGILHQDTPAWGFLVFIVGVDVAHVWSTLFRVYLDRSERARRPLLYYGLPILCYGAALVLYGLSHHLFWRCLAYFAVYHFVRQQLGFLSLYRRKALVALWERWLERVVLLLAMLYPLAYWHTRLPLPMWWMIEGDFIPGLPPTVLHAFRLLYALLGIAYISRQVQQWARGRIQWGPPSLVLATAVCWYVGIVAIASDYAFTVSNVVLHGLPYALLTYHYGRKQAAIQPSGGLRWLGPGMRGVLYFLAVVWSLALLEELLWHGLVFHDQEALFGPLSPLQPFAHAFWTPLLAVPQLTHYVLDGIVWKRRHGAKLS